MVGDDDVMGQRTDFEGRAIVDVSADQPTVVAISRKCHATQVVSVGTSAPMAVRTVLIARPDPVRLPDAKAGRTTTKNWR